MAGRNAIEDRLDIIEESWFLFTGDPDARVGRWRLDNDGIRMVEVFLEAQTLEGSSVPDLFVRLDVPFLDSAQHGLGLKDAFLEEMEAAAEEIREAGLDPEWPIPQPDPRLDDIGQLLAFLESFRQHYREVSSMVVVVLMPGQVGDPDAWREWVDRLIRHQPPKDLRFMVFDPADQPLLDIVGEIHPAAMMTLAPELDMPGAIDALARQGGGTGPPDLYRRFFVGMGTAAMRGDAGGALRLGSEAAAVAKRLGWTQQLAVVKMAMGSILLGAGKPDEALAAYRESGAAAAASRDAGDAGSDQVVLQAKIAEGAALLQAESFHEAAAVYEEALALGLSMESADPVILLECHRMAAFCHEHTGRLDAALHHLDGALDVAGGIEEPQRLDSTLPYVVGAIWRITDRMDWSGYRPGFEARLEGLLGPGWPARVQEKLPA